MREAMVPEEINEVVRRNRDESDDGICHSHDFCDANEVMLTAWQAAFSGTPSFLEGNTGPQASRDMATWNEAWRIAKGKEFRL
jgi:hypothetical protein